MQYPIVIHKDQGSAYGVIVPDLPGCHSAGDTLEDAIHNTHEAIECHLEGLLLDNEPIPQPSKLDCHLENPDYKEGVWVLIEIDLTKISGISKRINITLPERILKQIDEFTHCHGGNRSAFLVEAALRYISEQKQ